MIIDAHTHIDKANHKDWTPQQLITSMDEAGIDYSLVISNHVTEAPMEKIVEITKNNPRLKAIGNVRYDTFDDAQVQQIIGYLERKEIVGVKFYPGYEDYYPSNEHFDAIYSYCEKNGHPVMFHTGLLMIGCPGLLEQAHPLRIDAVANKYPNLKIVIAHMGNPWLIDTASVMWKNPNVYTDISGFFTEFQSISEPEIEWFIKRLSELKMFFDNFRKCIFGTDWPLYSQKEYLDAVLRLPLSPEEKDLLLWKNAVKVFNLDWK